MGKEGSNIRFCENLWTTVFESQVEVPSTGELLTLLNRGTISPIEFATYLQQAGSFRQDLLPLYSALRYEVPGPADLVRFAVRHVFEPDLIAHFGYNDEYRPVLDAFHAAQGVTYPIFSGPLANVVTDTERAAGLAPGSFLASYAQAGLAEPTWAQAYWWSHWILPSPSQGYEMVQRLRLTGGPGGGPRDPSGHTFTDNDLKLLLRANDYPPFWRDRLAAVSYRVVGLRQLAQLYRYGLAERPELIERWKDLGFSKRDAPVLADLTIRTEDRRRFGREQRASKAKVLDAYAVGTYDRAQAATALRLTYFEDPGDLAAYLAQTPEQQADQALADPAIRLQLEAVDVGLRARAVKDCVAGIKRQYVSGIVDKNAARAALLSVGVVSDRIDDYVAWWCTGQTTRRKELSASQVLRYATEGIIQIDEAHRRLSILGYPPADQQVMLEQIRRSIATAQAKAAVAQAKTAAQREQALARQVKALQREQAAAAKRLAGVASPARMEKWVTQSLLAPEQMRSQLLSLGWPTADADRAVEVAIHARDKYAAAAAKQKQGSGQTAGPAAAPAGPVPAAP